MIHYAKTPRNPGGRKLYYTLRSGYYWPFMAVTFYATVRLCTEFSH